MFGVGTVIGSQVVTSSSDSAQPIPSTASVPVQLGEKGSDAKTSQKVVNSRKGNPALWLNHHGLENASENSSEPTASHTRLRRAGKETLPCG